MRPYTGLALRGSASNDLPRGLVDLSDPEINYDDLLEARRNLHAGWDALGLLDDPERMDPDEI